MTNTPRSLACIILSCLAAATSSQAGSFTSSASSAGSASVGSLSDSIRGSSNSSRTTQVAEGDYRIIDVAEAADRPGLLRLTLQLATAAGQDGEFFLDLPEPTFARQGLARGDIVSAQRRPYGLAFARADTREAFFLVLADDWFRELDPRPVTL